MFAPVLQHLDQLLPDFPRFRTSVRVLLVAVAAAWRLPLPGMDTSIAWEDGESNRTLLR